MEQTKFGEFCENLGIGILIILIAAAIYGTAYFLASKIFPAKDDSANYECYGGPLDGVACFANHDQFDQFMSGKRDLNFQNMVAHELYQDGPHSI